MERVHKWLTVVQLVARLLAVALAAVAADTAIGDQLRGVVLHAAALAGFPAVAHPVPNASSLSLLVLPRFVKVT